MPRRILLGRDGTASRRLDPKHRVPPPASVVSDLVATRRTPMVLGIEPCKATLGSAVHRRDQRRWRCGRALCTGWSGLGGRRSVSRPARGPRPTQRGRCRGVSGTKQPLASRRTFHKVLLRRPKPRLAPEKPVLALKFPWLALLRLVLAPHLLGRARPSLDRPGRQCEPDLVHGDRLETCRESW